jgi:hypothetical protein
MQATIIAGDGRRKSLRMSIPLSVVFGPGYPGARLPPFPAIRSLRIPYGNEHGLEVLPRTPSGAPVDMALDVACHR